MANCNNEPLRRVEAFIAQLTAFKAEADRHGAQNTSATSPTTSAEDVERDFDDSGSDEQDCSVDEPSDEADIQPSVSALDEWSHDGTEPPSCSKAEFARHPGRTEATIGSIAAIEISTSRPTATTEASEGQDNSLGLEESEGQGPHDDSDVEVDGMCLAPNRAGTVTQTGRCLDCMATMPGHSVTLEFLQSLSDTGKKDELQSAMACCSTKELRSFCGGMGVRVRSKEYAAYHTKAGYTELLTQLLLAKSASKGLAVDPVPLSIVVTPVERTRKTKNCNLRLLNVIFSEFMAPFLSGMNAEPTQAEIDAGAVGGNNPFWTKFRSEFISSKAEYSRLAFQGASFTGFDLSTPVPHSSTKLSEMWSELWGAYNSALIRFSADPNLDFETCCPSRNDVLYIRRWLKVKPNLLSEICVKLPAITQNTVLLAPSVSTNEDVTAIEDAGAVEHVQNMTPSRKRPRMVTNRVARVSELSTTSDASNKDSERAFLMQSIRHAAEILTMARGSDLGSEVEETVRRELQQYTKRLKRIQQQTQDAEKTEEEEKN